MIGTILFTISFVWAWFTAEPILRCKHQLTKHWCNGWKKQVAKAIHCPPCSTFWFAGGIWLIYPYLPGFIIFAFNMSAIIGLTLYLKNKFIDDTSF